MGQGGSLTEMFGAGMDPPLATHQLPAELEQILVEIFATAQEQWPQIEQPTQPFLDLLARGAPATDQLISHLRSLCGADLYLASACARSDSRAIDLFEATYFPDLDSALRAEGASADQVAEIKQVLRERFFVARPDRSPRITSYRGRGSLHAWVRISGLRELYRSSKAGNRFISLDDSELEENASSDPELRFLKQSYRAEFRLAFTAAMAELSPRQRNLLRQSYLDRIGIDALGRIYRVHRATAARWLEAARQQLLQNTRQDLMNRLRLDTAECDSLLRLIESQLDVTLRSID